MTVVKTIKNLTALAVEVAIPRHILSKTGSSVTFVNFGCRKIAPNLTKGVQNADKGKAKTRKLRG